MDGAAHPAGDGHRPRLSLLHYLALVGVLVALWACGWSAWGSRTGILATTSKPAAELQLALSITGQYSNQPNVQIYSNLIEAPNAQHPGAMAAPAHLSCNGKDITPSADNEDRPCPRQPPGGAYHIVYTDERGVATTVTVPVPTGVFAILSPRPGARVPIPTNGALPVRFSTPLPAAQASVSIDSAMAACGDAQYPCGSVEHGPFDNATPTPVPVISPAATAVATPTILSCPPSPLLHSPLVTISGDQGTLILEDDFHTFYPGPGTIQLREYLCLSPDPAGFTAASVTFSDTLTVPITWTR